MILANLPGTVDWIAPIIQFGIGGGVLVWFMFKSEPRLKAIEEAIDRMSRAVLILIVELPHASDSAKGQAKSVIAEIDDATRKRAEK